MSPGRDAAWFGLAAAVLAIVAVLDAPVVFAIAAVVIFAVVGRALPHGGLLPGLAVGLVWSNAAAVLTDELSLPALLGLAPQVLLGMLLVWRMLRGDRSIAASAPLRVLLLYGAALLVSGFGAEFTEPVVDRYASFLAEGLLLWLLVVNVVDDSRTLRRVLTALVVVGGFLGALAVQQAATEAFDRTAAGFTEIDDDERDQLEDDGDHTPRPSVSIGDADRFARLLVVTLPLAVVLSRHLRGAGSFVLLTSSALVVGGIAVSGSRGALLGALAAVVLLAALRALPSRALLVVAGAAVAVLVLLPGHRERLWPGTSAAGDEQHEVDGPTPSGATDNLAALDMYLDHPLTGVGPGGYPLHHEEYAERIDGNVGDDVHDAPNLFLGTAAELGTAGVITLGAIFVLVLHDLWRARRALREVAPDLADLASALLVAVAVHLVTGAFLHLADERYLWLVLALADAAARILRRVEPARTTGAEVELSVVRFPARR